MNAACYRFSAHLPRTLSILLCLALSACGGGSSSGGNGGANNGGTGGGAPSQLTLAGMVTYTDYPLSSNGIDYSSPVDRPVRGVIVELLDEQGDTLNSGVTDTAGAYSFNVQADTPFRVLVRAELGSAGNANTRVVDNTRDKALYTIFADTSIALASVSLDLNAASGWNGSAYSGTRAAAPFAILDTIYQGQMLIRSVDSEVVFPLLTVNWSADNIPNDGDLAAGEIGVSFYSASQLYILGAAGLDTDEYDDGVIGHEWGHYIEDKFSRSDNIGGPHSDGDLLHPSVAYSEGFATAFSSIVRGNNLYIDTLSVRQAAASVINVERDNDSDTQRSDLGVEPLLDGYYSENSVMELVFDLYDEGTEAGDNVAMGFAPIYGAMTGGLKSSPAFSNIYTLLHYLKQANPDAAADIDDLAAAENIVAARADEFQDPEVVELPPIYTDLMMGVASAADSWGDRLQTLTDYGPVEVDNDGNKLLNQRFFKVVASQGGCHRVSVAPAAPTASADVGLYFVNGGYVDRVFAGEESAGVTLDAGETLSFAVTAFEGGSFFTVLVEYTPGQCLS